MQYGRKFLEGLYRSMLRVRLCEEGFVEPILTGEVRCPVHLYSGEEAVAAGVCAALSEKDYIFGSHRSHGHYLAKGGDMREMVAEVFCREGGCSKGRGGSMHLVYPDKGMLGSAPIVAGTIPLAVGAALASSIRRDGRVAVSFFGDGATGEGVLYESLNFAALRGLPIIFACENNFYSTHLPISECRPGNTIASVAGPFGMPSHRVDGNDVLKVYEAAREAVEACRRGEGPTFLEFLTYRLRGHVGPDDNIQGTHTDIRPPKEIAAWRRKDPIRRLRRHILESGASDEVALDKVRAQVEREVSDAFEFARRSPRPEPKELARHVFQD
jgi:pyruvate dehydrogenase E1 component alpha subunit